MRIAITVGHSILKNRSITSADGTKMGGGNEYKFNKYLAKHLVKALRKNGHWVEMIRCPENVFTRSSEERVYKLNRLNCMKLDLIIELHLNASSNKTAEGTEVLYTSARGRMFATYIQKQLSTVFRNRGILKRDNLYMLNQTIPVCVMLETFFCTNRKEWRWARLHKSKIAKLIADGVGRA